MRISPSLDLALSHWVGTAACAVGSLATLLSSALSSPQLGILGSELQAPCPLGLWHGMVTLLSHLVSTMSHLMSINHSILSTRPSQRTALAALVGTPRKQAQR